MSKKKLRFLGYTLDRYQHGCLIALIEMTAGRFGLHKKAFKNERDLWAVVSKLTGFSPTPDEGFLSSVVRISAKVRAYGLAWRDVQMASIHAKDLHDLMKYTSPLATPVTLYPKKIVREVRTPSVATKEEFYKSWEWRTVRMEVFKQYGSSCQCCGAVRGQKYASGEPVRLCVDHIKPLSKHWDLRLDRSNLQILCDECNMGKGNWDETDFRDPAPLPVPDEWIIEDGGLDRSILDQLSVHGETIQ
jgi:5-methylcytosine-specific restriction endonuclease McrA